MTSDKKKGLVMIVIIGIVTAFFSSVQLADTPELAATSEVVLVTKSKRYCLAISGLLTETL